MSRPAEPGRARDAGQVQERAERVAVGAGDARELLLVEGADGDVARRRLAVDVDVLGVASVPASTHDDRREAVDGARFFAEAHGLVRLVRS